MRPAVEPRLGLNSGGGTNGMAALVAWWTRARTMSEQSSAAEEEAASWERGCEPGEMCTTIHSITSQPGGQSHRSDARARRAEPCGVCVPVPVRGVRGVGVKSHDVQSGASCGVLCTK